MTRSIIWRWEPRADKAGTRFIATGACDAADAYKQAFLRATADDLVIIESPASMPARAIRNAFVERMIVGSEKITFCCDCLRDYSPAKAKCCISQALINAVKGDLDNGLIFCRAMFDQIREIPIARAVPEALQV